MKANVKTKTRDWRGAFGALFIGWYWLGPVALRAADDWNTVDPNYKHASQEAVEKWRDLKFGLRICMGQYTEWNIEASWPVLKMSNEKKQEYFDLYKTYNPSEFKAEEWMDLLQRGGLTYFTILTKHHDGLCMYDTKTRVRKTVNWIAPGGPRIEDCDLAYSIMDGPFKRDIIKELCDAAHRRGIAIDLYFSHIDWYDADFRMDPNHPLADKKFTSRDYDPAAYDRMIARHREQIREILSNYGKIDMCCLDIQLPDFCWPDVKKTIMMARQLQPDCLFRNRGIGAYGDYHTPENWIPDSPTSRESTMPWMVIYNLANLYTYDPVGAHYKPGSWIIANLIDICAKGGNFMLILGPDAKGKFHPEAVKRLEYAGDWLKINGEAIYKTRPWEHWKEGDGIRFTRSKDEKYVYAISLQWPGSKLALKSIKPREGSEIRLLGVEEALAWSVDSSGVLEIQIPQRLQDESARPCKQAYAFRIEGTPQEPLPAPRIVTKPENPFAGKVTVSLAGSVEGGRIVYTLDGSAPSAASRMYVQPITVRRGAILRARSFKPGMLASDEITFAPGEVRIQFQPKGAATRAGYLADCGERFDRRDAGLSYGWNADCTKQTRARGTVFCYFLKGQKWEIALPNGRYQVTVGLSNDRQNESTVNVEGVSFCRGLRLQENCAQITKTVEVRDGRLTIDSGDAKDVWTKVTDVAIRPAAG